MHFEPLGQSPWLEQATLQVPPGKSPDRMQVDPSSQSSLSLHGPPTVVPSTPTDGSSEQPTGASARSNIPAKGKAKRKWRLDGSVIVYRRASDMFVSSTFVSGSSTGPMSRWWWSPERGSANPER